ncbi:hypothetical protein K402DRAFT_420274 [Aulographum hederae CBS 113979]|uniref:Peptidase A1 domain-containing protein n=1 Tax=Aulographum hederae CBS 113979 TaxID=1176131 RepID=A0A6G1H331_9PEZI|nr:hypothetical protein K402DRAFT_420274 [Aulographum hederae CBS 113979]
MLPTLSHLGPNADVYPAVFHLGLNADLYPDWTSAVVHTVPFGINLGQDDHFYGSITVGGTYDANRVASTSWNILPVNPPGSNSTFLRNGVQNLLICFSLNSTSSCTQGTNSTLDFNNNELVLPAAVPCNKDFFISRELADGEDASRWDPSESILVPANITSLNAKACRNLDENDPSPPVLGRPFFQATYAYVNRSGAVFIVPANPFNLTVKAETFEANQTLVPITSSATELRATGISALAFTLLVSLAYMV